MQLTNKQTVNWRVDHRKSGIIATGIYGIMNTIEIVNKFYQDIPECFISSLSDNNKKDPNPSIGHKDIIFLCKIVTSDFYSFYWNKNESKRGIEYSLVYLESLVPEVRNKKTVFLFLEEHLKNDCNQESLQLLQELCFNPEKEDVKEYWKDVPDDAYIVDSKKT